MCVCVCVQNFFTLFVCVIYSDIDLFLLFYLLSPSLSISCPPLPLSLLLSLSFFISCPLSLSLSLSLFHSAVSQPLSLFLSLSLSPYLSLIFDGILIPFIFLYIPLYLLVCLYFTFFISLFCHSSYSLLSIYYPSLFRYLRALNASIHLEAPLPPPNFPFCSDFQMSRSEPPPSFLYSPGELLFLSAHSPDR